MGLYELLLKTAGKATRPDEQQATPAREKPATRMIVEPPKAKQEPETPARKPDIPTLKDGVAPKPHQERVIRRLVENDGKMVIAHGVGSGKCLDGKHLVHTNRGLFQLQDLFCPSQAIAEPDGIGESHPAPEWLRVLSLQQNGSFCWVPATRVYRQELLTEEALVQVVTRRGEVLLVTPVHPLPVIEGTKLAWKPAGTVAPGDFLVRAGNAVSHGEEAPVPGWFLRFAAWSITEGCDTAHSCAIAQNDVELLQSIRAELISENIVSSVRCYGNKTPVLRVNLPKASMQKIRALGYVHGRRSASKELPNSFLTLPKEQARELIQILFLAEGHIAKNGMEYSSASRKLCVQVQLLLRQFGIDSTLSGKLGCATNGTRVKRWYYRVVFFGAAVRLFHERIGLPAGKKAEALQAFVDRPRGKDWSMFGVPARGLGGALDRRGLGYCTRHMAQDSAVISAASARQIIGMLDAGPGEPDWRIGGTAGAFAARTYHAHRQQQPYIQALIADLDWLVGPDLAYDEVLSVAPVANNTYVYDLVVPDSHNFVIDGGAVVHNTLSSIMGFEKLRHLGKAQKAVVITPAGLRENYLYGGVEKFTTSKGTVARRPAEVDPKADYNIVSYETFRQDPVGIMQRTGADTIIVDEYHRVRNEQSSTYGALLQGRQLARNFIGVTGSPINNTPDELAALLSLSENNPRLTRQEFKSKFVRRAGTVQSFTGGEKKLVGIRNPAEFVRSVYPKVDYASSEDLVGKDMPVKKVTNVYVPMSDEQYKLYSYALHKLGPIAASVMRDDENVTVGDASMMFSRLAEARQVANSVHTGRKDITVDQAVDRTPKVRKIVEDTRAHLAARPDNQVVLYSNLINGGVDVLSAGLKRQGIEHALFIGKGTEVGGGSVTETIRQQGVEDYKNKKVRAIIISGAGAEGLDLKDSTAFYALDGHFNPERILQAEARARRLGGQAQRPPEQRVVDVRRYQSVVPDNAQPGFFRSLLGAKKERSTDQWVYDTAAKKYETNQQFYGALKAPHKYIRKVTMPSGKVRYVYPQEADAMQPNFFQRAMGAPVPKVEAP